jgi:hypothetical protein
MTDSDIRTAIPQLQKRFWVAIYGRWGARLFPTSLA